MAWHRHPLAPCTSLIPPFGSRSAPSRSPPRTEEIRESDIGTGAGLFEVVKIGDEFFTFVVDCKEPKACTIVLRGASRDILNEVRGLWRRR